MWKYRKYFLITILMLSFISCSKKQKLVELAILTIANVEATNISSSGATIKWTTDEPASSQVIYGKTTDYGSQTADDTNKTVSHSVNLSGLDVGTLYHFKVKSANSDGDIVFSEDDNFTTGPDTTTPVISNVAVTNISVAGATVSWITDEPATSQVIYGKTSSFGSQTSEDSNKTTSHSVALGALEAGNVYYYKVKSSDAAGNLATSGEYSFAVILISNVTASDITATSVLITWITDRSSTSQVYYGTSTAYGNYTVEDTNLVTNHNVTLTGLHAGTLYYFSVKSADVSNNSTFGSDTTLTTDTMVYLYFDDIEYSDGNNTVKIYNDSILIGSASGYMGSSNGAGLGITLSYATNPNSGTSCLRASYNTNLESWIGLHIKAGSGTDWTTTTSALAGLNIATNKLTFYARANCEVTMKEMGMGVNGSDTSGQNYLSKQVLNTTWQKFTVDLANKNVSNQIGLFFFTINKP